MDIIETKDYWIYEDKFIFKPDFNNTLDKFYNLISNYNELIFSDYDNLDILLETDKNNIDVKVEAKSYMGSKYNQPIQLNNHLLKSFYCI